MAAEHSSPGQRDSRCSMRQGSSPADRWGGPGRWEGGQSSRYNHRAGTPLRRRVGLKPGTGDGKPSRGGRRGNPPGPAVPQPAPEPQAQPESAPVAPSPPPPVLSPQAAPSRLATAPRAPPPRAAPPPRPRANRARGGARAGRPRARASPRPPLTARRALSGLTTAAAAAAAGTARPGGGSGGRK
ncbi:basic salivary proline-rich protein 1-like [Chroicocephalus ridibundus]|uniref:basic salivary proline-rich protein 1-like n=1 Tax=Chroicocephalus ridibundus TaxID=1192867 RepID=UPI002FDD71AF